MKLDELIKELNPVSVERPADVEARDVTHDSRRVEPGFVFVAIPGLRTDGGKFARQAVEKGAVAIISEQSLDAGDATLIQVRDARAALAVAASAIHGDPSSKLKLVGVTGTNGKTTTAHIVDSIIRSAEGTSALLGTIHYCIGDEDVVAEHTTPEASDIQRMLAAAVDKGCKSAAMEVSSHAIELRRADRLHFAATIFTNLTRDHLDYHKTMDAYFSAKKKLFDGSLGYPPAASVINVDDEYGQRLVDAALGRIITYSLSKADVSPVRFKLTENGIRMTARTPLGEVEIESSLVGRPHVYNILAATGAAIALGFNLEKIAEGISRCRAVAGRFESVSVPGQTAAGIRVVVDYAHTDDALKNALQTAREVADKGRVIVVFGCGGDRDRTKRAPMGEIAATLADIAIATSDNPRTEDPEAILRDIEVGLIKTGRDYIKITGRREAIRKAVDLAQSGDLVLVAGKGHETYQIIGAEKTHFDDREIAAQAIEEKLAGHSFS